MTKHREPRSVEHRAKLSAALKGNSNGATARWSKPESRAAAAEITRKMWEDPEYRAKASARNAEKSREYWASLSAQERRERTARMRAAARRIKGSGGDLTGLEVAVMLCLNELGVAYQARKLIGVWVVDFYVPEWHLVIEADGLFWHNNANVQVRDDEKTKELMKDGYNVLRLSPEEIAGDLREVILRAIQR